MLTTEQRHAFINGYIDAAIWCGVNEIDDDGDSYHTARAERHQLGWDALRDLVRSARELCGNRDLAPWLPILHETLAERTPGPTGDGYRMAGYLFWMTRHGEGCGFWELTDDSRSAGWPVNKGLTVLTQWSRERWPVYLALVDGEIQPD